MTSRLYSAAVPARFQKENVDEMTILIDQLVLFSFDHMPRYISTEEIIAGVVAFDVPQFLCLPLLLIFLCSLPVVVTAKCAFICILR
jgi:hypothetical protein